MCAAPGGKTTAIAMLMKDKGEVIAADRSHNKVPLLILTGDCDYSTVYHVPTILLRLNSKWLNRTVLYSSVGSNSESSHYRYYIA